MPHMAPIMWSMIMLMTFLFILVTLSMIYFGNSPSTPSSDMKIKEKIFMNWLW